jgi:hypothetical protein
MTDTIRIDWESMSAARRKYLQMCRQLEEGKRPHDDILHAAWKLGQFLDDATYRAFSADDVRHVEPHEAER